MTRQFGKRLFSHRQKHAPRGHPQLLTAATSSQDWQRLPFPKYSTSAGLGGRSPHTVCLGRETRGPQKPVMYSREHSQRSPFHSQEEPLTKLLIRHTFYGSSFSGIQNRKNKSKSEYSGHWATLTSIHFWVGFWSVWKHMVNIGGVSNVCIMPTHLYGCTYAFPSIYNTSCGMKPPSVVAVCIAIKTSISRMCPAPAPAVTTHVILGFHFLICKWEYQPPSSSCCKNKTS